MAFIDLLFKTRVRLGVNASEETLPFGAVQLDASIDESHTHANAVTQFPVEVGVDITDHVRRQPDKLRIRGLVTDHPIGFFGVSKPLNRSLQAYEKIRKMVDEAQVISVVTSLRTYKNMVIESVEIPRSAGRGNAVEMNLSLREIIFAEALDAEVIELGTQQATPIAV